MAAIITTSKTLIAKVRKGDPDAWKRFYDDYKHLMFNSAKAHGLSDKDAEDVIQNVMLGLWGKNDSGKTRFSFEPGGRATFKTWLRRVVKNKLIDHSRRKNPSAPGTHAGFIKADAESPDLLEGKLLKLGAHDEDPIGKEIERHWTRDRLRKALSLLEKKVASQTFHAFFLCKWEEQPPAAVAAQLGIERNAVDQLVHRCLRQLRTILKEVDAQSPLAGRSKATVGPTARRVRNAPRPARSNHDAAH